MLLRRQRASGGSNRSGNSSKQHGGVLAGVLAVLCVLALFKHAIAPQPTATTMTLHQQQQQRQQQQPLPPPPQPLGRRIVLLPWRQAAAAATSAAAATHAAEQVAVVIRGLPPGVERRHAMASPAARVSTQLLRLLEVASEELQPGGSVAPPPPLAQGLGKQQGAVERVLYVVNGTLAVNVGGGGGGGGAAIATRAGPGALVFLPAGAAAACSGDDAAHGSGCAVLTFSWLPAPGLKEASSSSGGGGGGGSGGGAPRMPLPATVWSTREVTARYQPLKRADLASRLGLDAHVNVLAPRTQLPRHADEYDVLLVVAEGGAAFGGDGLVGREALLVAGEALVKPAGAALSIESGAAGCKLVVAELHAPGRVLAPRRGGAREPEDRDAAPASGGGVKAHEAAAAAAATTR